MKISAIIDILIIATTECKCKTMFLSIFNNFFFKNKIFLLEEIQKNFNDLKYHIHDTVA